MMVVVVAAEQRADQDNRRHRARVDIAGIRPRIDAGLVFVEGEAVFKRGGVHFRVAEIQLADGIIEVVGAHGRFIAVAQLEFHADALARLLDARLDKADACAVVRVLAQQRQLRHGVDHFGGDVIIGDQFGLRRAAVLRDFKRLRIRSRCKPDRAGDSQRKRQGKRFQFLHGFRPSTLYKKLLVWP